MLDRFYKYSTENGLFRKEDKLLVAVSGGVDSVVLCHLLHSMQANFSIAHCNFGLRGKESDEDEAFVESLAEDFMVNFHVKKFDTLNETVGSGNSIQMTARTLRYEWFQQLAKQKEYSYILTAHHQNDVIETVLLNLTRGTGIAGLHGILPKKENLIRPLLFATKEELTEYAKVNNLSWRDDSSNESTKYNRNLIRLEVIPVLKKINPNLEKTIAQSIEKIAAAETVFDGYIRGCAMEFIKKHTEFIELEYSFLLEEQVPKIILFELIKEFGFNYIQVGEILDSLKESSGKKFISQTHLLVKDRGRLIITKTSENEYSSITLQGPEDTVVIPWLHATLHATTTVGFESNLPPSVAFLAFDKLKFPLTVRTWEEGDSFHPLGMKGKKKLSDFFTDLKIPLNLKKNTAVVVSDTDIVFVVGHRIDERYKAREGKPSLKLSLESNGK